MPSSTQPVASRFPLLYKIYFLYFEPFSALNGAFLLYFHPATYLRMTHSPGPTYSSAADAPDAVPESTLHIASHLVALYIMFALVEAVVPRVTSDMKVWKTVLCCILACDAAYISTLKGTGGSEAYWLSPWLWDLTAWGNFGSSWVAPITRVLFLLDVGMPRLQGQRIEDQTKRL